MVAAIIDGDPHDGPMPMDYFVWLVRNRERSFVIDTGFHAEMARKRKLAMRDAAYVISISRVAEACHARGWV